MPYLILITSHQIMKPLISLLLQMAERLLQAQPVSVANHIKARQSLIERSQLTEILLIYVLRIFCILYISIKLISGV